MSRKGVSLIEVLLVIFFMGLFSSFILPRFFDYKSKRQGSDAINWVKTILYMAQKQAQTSSQDHYVVFVPSHDDRFVKATAYFQRRDQLPGRALAIVKEKQGRFHLDSEWLLLPQDAMFRSQQDLFIDNDQAQKTQRIKVDIKDVSLSYFSTILPAVRFKSISGRIIFPLKGTVDKVPILIEGEPSSILIDAKNNRIELQD